MRPCAWPLFLEGAGHRECLAPTDCALMRGSRPLGFVARENRKPRRCDASLLEIRNTPRNRAGPGFGAVPTEDCLNGFSDCALLRPQGEGVEVCGIGNFKVHLDTCFVDHLEHLTQLDGGLFVHSNCCVRGEHSRCSKYERRRTSPVGRKVPRCGDQVLCLQHSLRARPGEIPSSLRPRHRRAHNR